MKNKKGQLTLGDAPTVVLLVGLVFLVMATIAFISSKMGESMDENNVLVTVTNETGFSNQTGYSLGGASALDFANPTITGLFNRTSGATVLTSNVSVSAAGLVKNTTSVVYNNLSISYTYTYTRLTSAYNTTTDLQTEISNNTSIAGIVLTISLVGIVLTVLIGVFLGVRAGKRV